MRLVKPFIKNIIFKFLMLFFENKKAKKTPCNVGIWSLLCHKDIELFIYSLMSFFYQLKRSLPVYVVDDGSLTPKDTKQLKKYFNVIVESQESSSAKMHKIISKYKYFSKFRFNRRATPLRKKFEPLFLSPFSKFIYLDADVLFYRQPPEILKWLNSKKKVLLYSSCHANAERFFDRDALINLAFRKLLYKHLSLSLDPTFNSGLLCVPNKKIIELPRIEKMFKFFYEISYFRTWLTEETAISLSFNHKYSEKLPVMKYGNVAFYEDYLKNFAKSKTLISLHYMANRGMKPKF